MELSNLLRENIIEITFTKKDGSNRVLLGTLLEKYLPIREVEKETEGSEKESTKKRSANIISVWDVENKGFRSIRKDSIISYAIKEGEN